MPLLLRIFRFFYSHTPLFKGKERILILFLKYCKKLTRLPKNITITSSDGRNFNADLNDNMYKHIYFCGYYEKEETSYFEKEVKHGDVVLDIGANFGWHTTLFSKLVGKEGKVHAFEPVPWIFEELKKNIKSNNLPDNIILNNFALGNKEGIAKINVFKGLPHGHSSLSTLGRNDYATFPTDIRRLDDYIREKNINKVDLIKIDVEGAELMVFEGAERSLKQLNNVKLLFEINFETCKSFGHSPKDLFTKLKEYGFTNFNKIVRKGNLQKIDDHTKIKHSDNVICEK